MKKLVERPVLSIEPGLPRTGDLPRPRHPLLTLTRRPGGFLLRRYWDIHVHGRDKVPSHGPAILAANHLGALDGPILVAAAPRPSFALAKIELFHGWVGRALLWIGQIPVNRRALDVSAITRAVHLLRNGQLLAVFPEGYRGTGEVSHARNGAAYLAMVTGAPVVPVAMLGTRESGQNAHGVPRRGAEMHVVFGDPLHVDLSPWPRRKNAVAVQTERIRAHLAEHVRAAQELTGFPLPGPPQPREVPPAANRDTETPLDLEAR
ncbi:1-acyl-sn-glycerol-3-phosphate acyltransferase [Friedmanniella endophytica]|uniref:1-acyl-sn-glycerol-3-phosphate acyltransferase n=1 Tax=Microlunatus kandeliicorticis TaxID=1759536 RepID=A0A7W3ITN3_9ACTN|nr:lysophospholipid acyltransferase family protein [Microlunatus kandeliicorticis]MBA8795053.1 1-acyl-sn-glycerol-3-phosphate acyltransferase [Microlunatus kandeliicorticis]